MLLSSTLLLAAACSPSSGHPAVLGGCTEVRDSSASCGYGAPGGGGGSSGGSGGGTMDAASVGDASATSCGASSVATANLQCAPCIVASCCQAGTACADSSACTALLSCNASNINACEMQYASGVTAYNDFAGCLLANCSPECPTLPVATAGDL
jgi:hypothetical protein